MKKLFLSTVVILTLCLTFTSCKEKTTSENAEGEGTLIIESTEDVMEDAQEVVENAQDAIQKTIADAEQALTDAQEAAENAVGDAKAAAEM